MALKTLDERDVLQLLRDEVKHAGGQSAWARNEDVDRTHLNQILSGRSGVSPKIFGKLRLRTVYVRENILSEKGVVELLRDDVDRLGGQSVWARETKLSRPYLNKVLAGRKRVSPNILQRLQVQVRYVRD